MAENSEQISLQRLEEDRNGLVNYIAELKHRVILAEGALQYLNKLLGKEDKSGD